MGRSADNSPFYGARAVTAAATPLPNGTCRGIYVGTSGTVTGIPADGGPSVSFQNVPVGTLRMQFSVISACPAGTLALY